MPRQPNGRSDIRLGKDGRYHSWVTIGVKPDGSLRRRHINRASATEVANVLTELESRRAGGATIATQATGTAGEWFSFYLEHIVKPNRAYKTYRAYESIFNLHVIPNVGGYRLVGMRRLLEPEHLETLYSHLRSREGGKLAPSYILQVHHVVSRALKVAVRRGRASRNACDLIDPPQGGTRHIESLGLADARAVFAQALQDRLAPRWGLGLLLGYRQGEALAVRWHYLDLEAGTIRPLRQLQRRTWEHGCTDPHACALPHCAKKAKRKCPPTSCARHPGKKGCPPPCSPGCTDHARLCPERTGGGLVEGRTKAATGGGRAIPMPPQLTELFRVHREQQIRDLDAIGRAFDPKGLCFIGVEGAAIDPRRDHEAWEQLLRNAGVDDAALHAARHTAGTLMVAGGTDISVVQEILRHASITTTRGYVDVAAGMKREAVERIALSLFDGDLVKLMKAAEAARELDK